MRTSGFFICDSCGVKLPLPASDAEWATVAWKRHVFIRGEISREIETCGECDPTEAIERMKRLNI